MTPSSPAARLHALVLAPRGRDAAVAKTLIGQAEVEAVVCDDLPALVVALSDDVAFVMMTEETIRHADLKPLAYWLAHQPAWSDLPFILVTDHGGGVERNPVASRWLETFGNVTFLERPFHPTTLVSIARAANKGRHRQHETRRLVEDLREGDARLRTALRAGRLGPWEFDFATRKLVFSEEIKNAIGRSPKADFGIHEFFASIDPEDRARVAAAIQHCVASGEDFAIEFRSAWRDGSRHWIDVRARLVRDAASVPQRLVGLISDITARKTAEEALQQVNEQLERRVSERTDQLQRAHDELLAQITERERTEEQLRHMQKLESIGELTGGVAHDFNNLLTAVIGNLELVRKRVPHDPSIDRLIDGALQGAQRGAALTQRLLAFARRQTLEPRPVDLAGLIDGMANLLRRSIGPSVEMELDVPRGLPPVEVDANQIEMALLNLVINARDAMPDGGRLTIALRRRESGDVSDLAAGHYVCLSVLDTGVGMDAATVKRAIEPFFSTKGIGKGTGLGLSMVHGVALQLRGALRLISEPGHGTQAELWLPIATGEVVTPVARGGEAEKCHRCDAPAGRRRFSHHPQHQGVAGGSRAHGDRDPFGRQGLGNPAHRKTGRPDDHRLRDAGHDGDAAC